MSEALERLKNLAEQISSYELARKSNIERLKLLYAELGIDQKVQSFEDIFSFKAMNLSGVSLDGSDVGTIKEGKYIQILAILYDKSAQKKAKNISLGYFGRSEKLPKNEVKTISEFVLRWRFEKSFLTLQKYHALIGRV